jgi:hypothetical protein
MKDKYKKKKKPVSYKVRRSKLYLGSWAVVKNGEEIRCFSSEVGAEAYKAQLIKKEKSNYGKQCS